MKTETTYFNHGFALEMTREEAFAGSHRGECYPDCAYLASLPHITTQLQAISDDDLVAELREYGAWDNEELANRHENEIRLIWIAAGNIREEIIQGEAQMKLKPFASNMTVVEAGNAVVLFSYQTPVACHIQDQGYFRTSKKWSVTTSRHINKWLSGYTAEEKPQEFFDELLTTTSVF